MDGANLKWRSWTIFSIDRLLIDQTMHVEKFEH